LNPIEVLQHLEQSGLPAQQARAIANVIEQRREQLVTSTELKIELGALELRLGDKIAEVKDELEKQIKGLWRLGWPVLGVGVITWVLQIFGSELHNFFSRFFHA
jgi:hypothetical protein